MRSQMSKRTLDADTILKRATPLWGHFVVELLTAAASVESK